MRKRFTTSLRQRMCAGQALAVRRTLVEDPRASELIKVSEVMWSDWDPGVIIRPISPIRREADLKEFSLRLDAARTLAIEQYKSLDGNLSWLLVTCRAWHRPTLGRDSTFLCSETLNSSYHFRCERGGPAPPSVQEIAGELTEWISMARMAAVYAAKKYFNELTYSSVASR